MKYTDQVKRKFWSLKPKGCFTWWDLVWTRCCHGVNPHWVPTTRSHWVPTTRVALSAHHRIRTECPPPDLHWVPTTRFALNKFDRGRTTLVSMVRTGCLSQPVRTMKTQWMIGGQSLSCWYRQVTVRSVAELQIVYCVYTSTGVSQCTAIPLYWIHFQRETQRQGCFPK